MATRIGQMAQELARTNPWWRSNQWVAQDSDLRAVQETNLEYRSPCLDDLTEGGLYLLRGPRRVGKTVAIKQTIERLVSEGTPSRAIVRVAADTLAADDLRALVQNAALPALQAGARRWWFFDEITATTGNWAAQVKWLRDNDPELAGATVVLTGSNAASLTAASGVLAGRRGGAGRRDRTLLPLGFRSFASLVSSDLPQARRLSLAQLRTPRAGAAYLDLLPWLDALVQLWETYVVYGGFPVAAAAAASGDPIPGRFVDDVFDTVFRDAFASSRLGQATTTALLERFFASMATPANLSKIGGDVELSNDVVAGHLGYLRDAYLVWRCPQKREKSWTAKERGQDKIYAVDPLVARLPHLRNSARADIDLTVLTEMQLGMALHRAAEAEGAPWEADSQFFYVRTPARKEIDFVGEPMAGAAIEAKYVETGRWRREAATVEASGYRGILVTRNVLDVSSEHGTWAVPAGVLAYLLDT